MEEAIDLVLQLSLANKITESLILGPGDREAVNRLEYIKEAHFTMGRPLHLEQ